MGFSYLILIFVTITSVVASSDNSQNSSSAAHKHSDVNCLSWRVAVETNNLKEWTQVPASCVDYVRQYILGDQYRKDHDMVVAEAYKYARGLNLAGDGKDVWIFDIGETTLSNIPYYARDDVSFGYMPFNGTKYDQWVKKAVAPAIPGSLRLYKQLINMGYKIVFLSGTKEAFRQSRIKNLKAAGYTQWMKLILKGDNDHGNSAVYKSSKRRELEKGGYRIRGNMGDQWSDLLGSNPGERTFKLPDPMYYIA